jgi:hypothetical protein
LTNLLLLFKFDDVGVTSVLNMLYAAIPRTVPTYAVTGSSVGFSTVIEKPWFSVGINGTSNTCFCNSSGVAGNNDGKNVIILEKVMFLPKSLILHIISLLECAGIIDVEQISVLDLICTGSVVKVFTCVLVFGWSIARGSPIGIGVPLSKFTVIFW